MQLLAFGYGQLLFSITLFSGYWAYFLFASSASAGIGWRDLLPRQLSNKRWLDRRLLDMTLLFTVQSLLKWLITFGESLVLKFSASLLNQDVYSTINSLGMCGSSVCEC